MFRFIYVCMYVHVHPLRQSSALFQQPEFRISLNLLPVLYHGNYYLDDLRVDIKLLFLVADLVELIYSDKACQHSV